MGPDSMYFRSPTALDSQRRRARLSGRVWAMKRARGLGGSIVAGGQDLLLGIFPGPILVLPLGCVAVARLASIRIVCSFDCLAKRSSHQPQTARQIKAHSPASHFGSCMAARHWWHGVAQGARRLRLLVRPLVIPSPYRFSSAAPFHQRARSQLTSR